MTLIRNNSARAETRRGSGSIRVGDNGDNRSALPEARGEDGPIRTETRGVSRSTRVTDPAPSQAPRTESRGDNRSTRTETRPGNPRHGQTTRTETRAETRGGGRSSPLSNHGAGSSTRTMTRDAGSPGLSDIAESQYPLRGDYQTRPDRDSEITGHPFREPISRYSQDPQIRQLAIERDDHLDWLNSFDPVLRERIIKFSGNAKQRRRALEEAGRHDPELRRRPSFQANLEVCAVLIAYETEILPRRNQSAREGVALANQAFGSVVPANARARRAVYEDQVRQDPSLRRHPSFESTTAGLNMDVERRDREFEEQCRACYAAPSRLRSAATLDDFDSERQAELDRHRGGTARERRRGFEDQVRRDPSLRRHPSFESMTAGLDMDVAREDAHDAPSRHRPSRRDGTVLPPHHASTRRDGGLRGTRTTARVVPSGHKSSGHRETCTPTRRTETAIGRDGTSVRRTETRR
ncbi:MAG: hypothetical protein Q9208_006755 [Pyrenodesmia sp. 3 TL-2023]